MRLTIGLTLLLMFNSVGTVSAEPSRVIVLRHGEKTNSYALCEIGQDRSLALRAQFLGKGAEQSIFDQPPAAFFATTLHTLELVAPAADSWGLPVITYAVVPLKGNDATAETDWITRQTQRAAAEVMKNPRWNGQTVVMAWEHKHIANEKLAKDNPNAQVDLRQLLNLDQLPIDYRNLVPKNWSGSNFNYFWVIDYNSAGQPITFKTIRQNFTGQFSTVPNNAWDTPEGLHANSGCK